MAKRAFDKIMAGLAEAVEIAEARADPGAYRLHIPPSIDVKALRKRLGLTQEAFALRYGFTLGRLRDWEQKRSQPEPAHRILLTILEREPEAVQRALAAA